MYSFFFSDAEYQSTIVKHSALYFNFIMRNGLSFFYRDPFGEQYCKFGDHFSLFGRLFTTASIQLFQKESLLIVRRLCHRLLALGYGRRELHPGDLFIPDERLRHTRRFIELCDNDLRNAMLNPFPLSDRQWSHQLLKRCQSTLIVRRELQALVDQFDAGPLTLQQLARIVIRRAVGGIHFELRVRTLSALLPRPLFKYVASGETLDQCF